MSSTPRQPPQRPHAHDKASDLYAFCHRPRCPLCQSPHLQSYKSIDQGDSVLRYTRCAVCGARFKLVME